MKPRDIIVGLLIFVSFAVALYFAINLGGTGGSIFRGGTQNSYVIVFPNVAGLQQNAPVWISGVPKGKVKSMTIDSRTGTVDVEIALDSDITLNKDCHAEIIPSSAFGGKAIAMEMGQSPEPLPEGEKIRGELVEDLFTAASRGISKINEGIDIAVDTIKDINQTVKDVRAGRGAVGTILFDEKVAGDVAATVENVRIMSEDAKSITSNVKDITEKVNNGEGAASLLLEDADTAMRIKNIVKNVEDATDNTVGVSRSIKSIVEKVDSGKGFFGVLLNDEETGEDIKAAVSKTPELMDSVKKVTDEIGITVERVNAGEGTVGKLFTDDTLFNDTLNAINTLRSGFEDIREQAPITTFASLLFQVFQ
jgi:phospholipid/cholesterol/gamma-HCH transport system substrate-binding protein